MGWWSHKNPKSIKPDTFHHLTAPRNSVHKTLNGTRNTEQSWWNPSLCRNRLTNCQQTQIWLWQYWDQMACSSELATPYSKSSSRGTVPYVHAMLQWRVSQNLLEIGGQSHPSMTELVNCLSNLKSSEVRAHLLIVQLCFLPGIQILLNSILSTIWLSSNKVLILYPQLRSAAHGIKSAESATLPSWVNGQFAGISLKLTESLFP